jgi:hypothetical protein
VSAPSTARWAVLLARLQTVETSLPAAQVAAALETVVTSPAVLRELAAALAADPAALSVGAPPVVGRLVAELVARGSATLHLPSCAVCARTGYPLTRSAAGGVCARCRARQLAARQRAARAVFSCIEGRFSQVSCSRCFTVRFASFLSQL